MALSDGHPMMDWMRFMAQLMRAQHAVATSMLSFPALDVAEVERAVEARMPRQTLH